MSSTYGAGIIVALIAVASSIVIGVKALGAAHQAQVAADMAAVAAAWAVATGDVDDPCRVAQGFAEEHGAQLETCRVHGQDVHVGVARWGRHRQAIAGPVE